MRVVCVLALVGAARALWSDGHRGTTRAHPSGWATDEVVLIASAPECFAACRDRGSRCTAWTFAPAGCNGATADTCSLHREDRPPTRVQGGRCALGASGSAAAADGLAPLKWKPLKLGSVSPTGWLRNQLVVFANGLSGHLDLFWHDVNESVWIGGTQDHSGAGHERGPYWLNGMVPLVAQLNATGVISELDTDINAQVNHWINYILDHQLPSGWLGPDDGFGGKGNDYWSGWNIAASLLSYADAMPPGDATAARCNAAVLKYIQVVYTRMQTTAFTAWSQNRWQDWAYIIHWLLDTAPQGQEQMLWDAAALTQQQSWDWDAYYDQTGVGRTGAYVSKPMPKFLEQPASGWTMYDHGVNNAMGTKSCATWYRQSKNETELSRSYKKLAMQDEFHGQPHGMFSADECFGGRNLNRGIELCAVVEQMYSLQHIFRVTGDPYFMDRQERIMYNALPGTITPTSWAHQYLQQANEINALFGIKDHVWQTDGPDSTGFGVEPNFGCCTANMQQGWPKAVNNLLLESGDGDTLLLALIAPFDADAGDKGTVSVATTYPFGDTVTVTLSQPKRGYTFAIRVPGWADRANATVAVGGGAPSPAQALANGTLHSVSVAAGKTTTVVVSLNPQVRVETGWGSRGVRAVSPVEYDPAGAAVPCANASDLALSGGAGVTADAARRSTDVRTGDPGKTSTIALAHALDGRGHAVSGVSLSFRYVAGYGPRGPVKGKPGATVSLQLVCAASGKVLANPWTSPPLVNASYDDGDPFSPPVTASAQGLAVSAPGNGLVAVRLVVANNGRNLQVDLASMQVRVTWSAARAPGPPPPPFPPGGFTVPPTNAAAVLRGPLVYSLMLEEQVKEVRAWEPFGNLDVDMTTSSTWNYALDLSKPTVFAQLGAPGAVPFNISGYPGVIRATARELPGWGASHSAADEPPASPIDCAAVKGGCGGAGTAVTLVPYGMTDLRMAALPWIPRA